MRREKSVVVMLVLGGSVVLACGDEGGDPSTAADASVVATGGAGGEATGGTSGSGATAGVFETGGTAGVASGGVAGGAGVGGTESGGTVNGTGGMAPACVPGGTHPCTCPNGASGAQRCNDAGTGYGACLCEGGTGGTGGDGGCTADTSGDPMNCGACGHVCAGDCVDGMCAAAFGACVARTDWNNCGEYCGGINQGCVPGGCDGFTWQGWGFAGESQCVAQGAPNQTSDAGCEVDLPTLGGTADWVRCCCGD